MACVVAAQVTDKHFDTPAWQAVIPRNSGKGENELKWLTRHVIAQHATAAKRQMRYNQMPRKMLQKLQMQHHAQNSQAQRAKADSEVAAAAAAVSARWDTTSDHRHSASDMDHQLGQGVDMGNASLPRSGEYVDHDDNLGTAFSPGSHDPWDDDKKVIQTATARNRMESSLAAIQGMLRTGLRGDQAAIRKTVTLTYALVFGTVCPMLQSVYNIAVLYQREFDLCQQIMCKVSGTCVRLFGSGWKMIPDILAPGMREFALTVRHEEVKTFDRLEVAVCYVWMALLKSAERNYVSQVVLDAWVSIPQGLWGEGRTETVPLLARAKLGQGANSANGADHGSSTQSMHVQQTHTQPAQQRHRHPPARRRRQQPAMQRMQRDGRHTAPAMSWSYTDDDPDSADSVAESDAVSYVSNPPHAAMMDGPLGDHSYGASVEEHVHYARVVAL
jgi:hypothetical protein